MSMSLNMARKSPYVGNTAWVVQLCVRFQQEGIGAMSRKSRDKGLRMERAIVRFLQDRGFAAERVPLSGAAGGSYLGDVTVPILGVDRVAEVKVRASGFGQLYAWLEA